MRRATRDPRLTPEGPWALRLAAWIGRRQLEAIKRGGLPVYLHEPLEFLLERQTPSGDFGPLDRVEAMRAELARQQGVLATFDASKKHSPSPEHTWRVDELRPPVRSMSDTAHVSSVPAVWGVFLYLCAKAAGARTIVELGAAVGISGCYLGSAPSCRRFITVEGDPERARLAEIHLRGIVDHAQVVTASFEAALDRVLPDLHDGIDLAFIDGDKTQGSYLALLDRLSPRLNPGAVVVFDDIQWSDVRSDWSDLCTRRGLSFAVNVGRFGVCVWDGGTARPQAFTLYGIGGVDLYRLKRDLMVRLRR